MENELRPQKLNQALSLRRSRSATPCMGGTATVDGGETFLALEECEEFTRIDTDSVWVHIGAGATAAQLNREGLVPELLRAAARQCPADRRQSASLGGAVCKKNIGVLCALTALDATLTLASENGRRSMGLGAFYTRRGLNLSPDELLCEILVPEQHGKGYVYQRLEGELTLAATLRWEKRRVAGFTAAFGGLGPGAVRYGEFERELTGLTPNEAKALRSRLMEAYRRYLPGEAAARETLLAALEQFFQKNGI